MEIRRRRTISGSRPSRLIVAALATIVAAAAAAAPPITVSPGGVDRVERTASACPTFSWGHQTAVVSWQLVVHRLVEVGDQAGADDEWREVLSVRLPGSVGSWTPSFDDCLEPGETYAWFVGSAEDTWSHGRLFEIVEPRAAELERVQALLGERLARSDSERPPGAANDRNAERPAPTLRPPSPARKASAGTSGTGFSVDGQGTAWGNAFILRCGNGAASEYFLDLDGDGYGDPVNPALACVQPAGYVADNNDCNDDASGVNPGLVEVCNGNDTDCDGTVDGGVVCDTGEPGVCAPGTETCVESSLVCVSDTTASAEVCDTLDNNCDGQVDEGNPGGGGACDTGQPGICAPGTQNCSGGILVCTQNSPSTTEVCDNLDNNCDGQADEGNPGGGGPCPGQVGVCTQGVLACSGGTLTCDLSEVASYGPEICDGLDNDCNGAVDDGVCN